MIKLKACPRCHGDIAFQKDAFGAYFSCMQCGFARDLAAGAVGRTTHPRLKVHRRGKQAPRRTPASLTPA